MIRLLINELFTGYGVEFLPGPLYDLNQSGEVVAGKFNNFLQYVTKVC